MSFLSKLLATVSGNTGLKISEQLLFDKVIGFRGIVPGVGTSTLVQNVAIALSESTNFSIAVLDTAYLYPTMYPMLTRQPDDKRVDYLDFNKDLSPVVISTAYRNVSLVSLYGRTVVDMFASKDSELTLEGLLGSLKSYFDVILVDLSHEMTNVSTHAAIKCNRIINVADYSLKCVYNLRKSINTMATLGVPLAKATNIVINKVVPDVLTNVRGVVEGAGLKVIGEIPFSLDIAKLGLSGKRIYSTATTSRDVLIFSAVVETILRDTVKLTPLNDKYIVEQKPPSAGEISQLDDDVTLEELLSDPGFLEPLEGNEASGSLEVAEPVESVESSEPVESFDLVDSPEVSDSVEPVESVEPLDLVDSPEPVESFDLVDSPEVSDSVEPVESVEPESKQLDSQVLPELFDSSTVISDSVSPQDISFELVAPTPQATPVLSVEDLINQSEPTDFSAERPSLHLPPLDFSLDDVEDEEEILETLD